MRYLTCCVNSTADLIHAMVDQSREVTLKTFEKNVGREATIQFEREMQYADRRKKRDGLKMKDDFAVRFYKSVYDGQPCYYVDHSRIEYIFV